MFAECAQGRTISFLWACQTQKKAMNRCLKDFINDAELAKRKKAFVEDQLAKYRTRLQEQQAQDAINATTSAATSSTL